jgi:ABC-type proline/glycine betaine transport system ATPase subunit
VFVTHDEQEAHALADRIVVLDRGRITQDTTLRAPDRPMDHAIHHNGPVTPHTAAPHTVSPQTVPARLKLETGP